MKATKAPSLKQIAIVLHALSRIEHWDGAHRSIEESICNGGGWLTIDVNQKLMPMPSTDLLTAIKLLSKVTR